ncbi:hypothetical protein CTAYLR_002181 [Chrysophaeum taylorii]|uniref:STI1 domain-containing protein n=1 Tax=Chrysophaeum taylorii TaxID=2483200 RepID=A0AAD7UQI8_9STRA|nr:hypothetical protein CTAYLR_002181 [Chrysophaeum taylorii]
MNLSREQWDLARDQMGQMDPEDLKSQARQMKMMDKMTVRRMNPQFAAMSDAQIDMCLNQMELMASNPAMMQMARQQMSSMSHEQANAQVAAATGGMRRRAFEPGDRVELKGLAKAPEHNGKLGTVVGSQGERFKVQLDADSKTLALKEANLEKMSSQPLGETESSAVQPPIDVDEHQFQQAQRQMQDPEAMRAQASMLRTMDPDTIRRSNPQMANLSDQQIRATADQLEMVANNPDMLEMARKQMANMTPEQETLMRDMLRKMQQPQQQQQQQPSRRTDGGSPASAPPAGGAMPGMPDAAMAAKMMENMDPSQIEQMLNVVKENPEMIKQALKSNPLMAGMSPEMVDKQLEMLDQIPPEQLKRVLGWATKAQKVLAPVVNVYTKVDRVVGGRLKSIILAALVALLAAFVARLFGFFRPAVVETVVDVVDVPASSSETQQSAPIETIVADAIQTGIAAFADEDDEFQDLDAEFSAA